MATDINMFGPGGEDLAGMFVGQDFMANQRAKDMEAQKTLADIANTQAITRQRDLGNQLSEAQLPYQIKALETDSKNKAEDRELEKFGRIGQSFGRMSSMLDTIPPAARPAAVRQMAAQAGIGEDNPMLTQLMNTDPNELPSVLNKFSEHFYNQGDVSRKQTQVDKANFDRTRMQRDSQEKIAAGNNATTLAAANIAAAASRANAATRADASAAGKPLKESIEQTISRMLKEKVDSGEITREEALDQAQRFKLGQATVGKSDAAAQMGMSTSPAANIESIIRGGAAPRGKTGGMPQVQSNEDYAKLPPGTKYTDPNGNIRTKR